MTTYDNQFNSNEWFVIAGLCIGYSLLFLLPRRFSLKVTAVFIVCGIYSGFFYDHSLSVEPVNFYDVNDGSLYQIMDFISYVQFGSWSYLFFYIWDWLQFKYRLAPLYIFLWGSVSLGMEKIAVLCHVYHYRNGYSLSYSLPIYFLTLSIWIGLYYYTKVHEKQENK